MSGLGRVRSATLVLMLGVTLAALGTGVGVMAQGPTNAELDSDLAAVHKQEAEAQADADRYSGMIGTYADLRVQVLKSVEAMLEQKRLSILRGITLTYRDPVSRVSGEGSIPPRSILISPRRNRT